MIGIGLFLGQLTQLTRDSSNQNTLDFVKQWGGLNHLPGNIERQIFRVDHALDEAQVIWQQFLKVFPDENLAGVELQAVILFNAEQKIVPL